MTTPLKVVVSQDSMSQRLMDEIRAVYMAPKYNELHICVLVGVLEMLKFEIMERNVWSKAANDSTGLINYYNQHKSNYAKKRTQYIFNRRHVLYSPSSSQKHSAFGREPQFSHSLFSFDRHYRWWSWCIGVYGCKLFADTQSSRTF